MRRFVTIPAQRDEKGRAYSSTPELRHATITGGFVTYECVANAAATAGRNRGALGSLGNLAHFFE
jgi:hypothetical protein